MNRSTNLYAEKVFSEHPVSLWAMDEDVHYVSLITENQRSMPISWTTTDLLLTSEYTGDINSKVDSVVNSILLSKNIASGSLSSPILFSSADINFTMPTISISSYVYQYEESVIVSIGYRYKVVSSGLYVEDSSSFALSNLLNWSFVSNSFDTPSEEFEDFQILFSVSRSSSTQDASILLNGMSVGQWSEQFHAVSVGSNLQVIPENIALSGYGVEARAYGLQDNPAYYLSESNALLSRNAGMPLVYGARNSTEIRPSSTGLPSFIFPGMGFMNGSGKYSDLTLELWLKIQTSTTTPKRILGPIATDSSDGLYVYDSFLMLKIGEDSQSVFVKEWDRPMLLAIRLSESRASVVLNGSEVISITINKESLSFPEKTIVIDDIEKNQDWIGIYGYPDVPLMQLDCIGIYSYIVPSIVEKRRFVYGQAVQIPESISGVGSGASVTADYPLSKYSRNYIYPDIGKWSQGISENLAIDNDSISPISYNPPSFVFSDRTYDSWIEELRSAQDDSPSFFTLKPNSLWQDTEGYMLFPSMNMVSQGLSAFYGVFQLNSYAEVDQTLFYIKDRVSGDTFEIYANSTHIVYKLVRGGQEVFVPVDEGNSSYVDGDYSVVGLNFKKFSTVYGAQVAKFFGDPSQLDFYVGGSESLANTFLGKIFKVGFCSPRNLQKISQLFSDDGTTFSAKNAYTDYTFDGGLPETESWLGMADAGNTFWGDSSDAFSYIADSGGVYGAAFDLAYGHMASYTLVVKEFIGEMSIDVETNGYWQDYVPLGYFGKMVPSGLGTEYLDVDPIQFNISYPKIKRFIDDTYNTESLSFKSYISFDMLGNPASIDIDNYSSAGSAPKITKTQGALSNNVVFPGEDWETTRYEILSDSVIYPPANENLADIKLVLHLEFFSGGQSKTPVSIESLQLAGQVLSATIPNAIGTKYGTDIFPYRRSAGVYNYKEKSPHTIYKGSTPYLHLTSNSGFRVQGFLDNGEEHGIEVPVNPNQASFYKVAAMQMNVRYDGASFPSVPTSIFEIESANYSDPVEIKFYMVPESINAQRAKIYAINSKTGEPQNGLVFFINGNPVSTPIIDINSWAMIGIAFNPVIDFSSSVGAIRITGPIIFNNMSQYLLKELDEQGRSSYRKWVSVLSNGDYKDWDYWEGSFTWQTVLYSSEQVGTIVDGEEIYNRYVGVDRIIVDTDRVFTFKNYKYLVYKDNSWQSSVTLPA